ncbi:MAG: O-antigen ligase family protein [Longimicrobiales bacterium]
MTNTLSAGKSGAGIVLLALASLGVGAAVAYFGPVAILAAVGVFGAVLMVRRPLYGLVLLVATLPIENASMFEGFTAARIIGIAVAAGWLVGKLLRNESFERVFSASITWLSGAFVLLVLASTTWAGDPTLVPRGVVLLTQLVVLGMIVLDVVDSWDEAHLLLRALIVGGLVGAGLTLYDSIQTGGRAGEAVAGINGTAEIMVTLMPFAFYLVASERSLFWRLLPVAFIGVGSGAVVGTMSRWSMMLLPAVILIMTIQVLRAGRGRGWLLLGFAALTIALFSQEDSFERLERRIQSIMPYLSTTVQADAAGGLSGRGYHLAVGVAMFRDYPILGVGYNNFGDRFLYEYQYRVPGGNNLWTSRRSPHSSHVGILAELGLVGALLWFGVLFSALLNAWRASRTWETRADRVRSTLIFGLLVSLLLQAGPYAMYGPNQNTKLLWVLVGLSVAVWRLAREDEAEAVEVVEGEAEWWIEDELEASPERGVGRLAPLGLGALR